MAVKGAILGDILGSPYEFYRPDDFHWKTVPLTGKLPVGFTDDKVISYRIDRMIHVELCTKEYVPLPDGCELTAFTKEVFKMYDGVDQEVDLICDNALMKNLVDHFGDDFIVRAESKETFRATVKVSVSRTFYAWVFQFAGCIRIAGPESVREEYMEMLKNAMK